jgi:hypothetical protein
VSTDNKKMRPERIPTTALRKMRPFFSAPIPGSKQNSQFPDVDIGQSLAMTGTRSRRLASHTDSTGYQRNSGRFRSTPSALGRTSVSTQAQARPEGSFWQRLYPRYWWFRIPPAPPFRGFILQGVWHHAEPTSGNHIDPC